ncbi:MAG: thiolase family protein [Candidatus Marsarchaeota archaeon]|jgi:acetyl-CoA C-acetyltransferase|nr:thiolase family protein [Candidatus Marsarchaeota archaeon]
MEDAYIVEAVRSPMGKFLGSLSGLTAPKLACDVVLGLLEKTGVDPLRINEIISGNVLSAGLGQNPAKQVIVYSGLSKSIPTLNVNMVCASGLRAVSLASQAVKLGDSDVVLAGGMENMSNSPHLVRGARAFKKLGDITLSDFYGYASKSQSKDLEMIDEMLFDGLWDCYSDMHMGAIAEKIGKRYGITREEQDKLALESHKRAASAADEGLFREEIIPIKLADGNSMENDEGIRRDTSIEKLAALKPAFIAEGTVTAGNSSQLSDGAAFALVMSGSTVSELGLKPIAKVESYAEGGIDPEWYGLSPVDTIKKALEKSKLSLDDIGLIELNEAFAVQVLGVVKELGLDLNRLNVNGGAIALGHPIGASGARLLSTLVHAMKARKKDYGMVSLCHGGGGSATMVLSRVD